MNEIANTNVDVLYIATSVMTIFKIGATEQNRKQNQGLKLSTNKLLRMDIFLNEEISSDGKVISERCSFGTELSLIGIDGGIIDDFESYANENRTTLKIRRGKM